MKIIRRFTPQIHCKFVKSERSFSLCVIHLMWPSCRQTKRKKCSTHSNNNNSFVVSLESGLRSGNESQETNYEDSQWWKQDERKAKTKYKYTFRGRFDVRGFYFLFIFLSVAIDKCSHHCARVASSSLFSISFACIFFFRSSVVSFRSHQLQMDISFKNITLFSSFFCFSAKLLFLLLLLLLFNVYFCLYFCLSST